MFNVSDIYAHAKKSFRQLAGSGEVLLCGVKANGALQMGNKLMVTRPKLTVVFGFSYLPALVFAAFLGAANLSAAAFVDLSSVGVFIAREAFSSTELADFYKKRAYNPIWVGSTREQRKRLTAFLDALDTAIDHGLPDQERHAGEIRTLFLTADTNSKLAKAEIAISQAYLKYARELHTGLIDPVSVSRGIARKRNSIESAVLLDGISSNDPAAFLATLPPSSMEYRRLRKELRRLREIVASGGWGNPISETAIKPGDRGPKIVLLRNRLIRMGLIPQIANSEYNGLMLGAVQGLQARHGMIPDGVVGARTIRAINTTAEERMAQILVALERARWLNHPLGELHVLVNLTDFKANVIDNGRPVFTTKVVVGRTRPSLNTPEFSEMMTHLVVNPYWWVPESIAVGEVLPELWKDPLSESQLEIFHPETGPIDRMAVDFTKYSKQSFPFKMRQPPGPDNALGLVKFMFPNKHDVYLHDTPEKQLFDKDLRAFSHGCVRLERAFDFAHFLLATRVSVSEAEFKVSLASGEETKMYLDKPLPVHITYQTAWVGADGVTNFRDDIYGRDSAIYEALQKAGISAT